MTEQFDLDSLTFNKGYLDVSHGHQIYYEQYGNPSGINILFLHGGPGIGCTEFDKRFFDPKKFNVLFFDQRGAGKSLPSRSIDNNTTTLLLDDMSALLDHFNIKSTHIFAGSWGSTLAMLFAIKNPLKVESMILRGYFPATLKGKEFFEKGGTGFFFPEAWEKIDALVPEENKGNVSHYYLSQLQSSDEEVRKKYAYELVYFNVATAKIGIGEQELNFIVNNGDIEGKSLIQCHYSANNFFLDDNYIINNIKAVKDIPISMIHGRYDMICPPVYAYELHKHLTSASLQIVDGGHLSSEPEIEKLLYAKLAELSD